MPIPSTIADLSTTANSNSPAGSDPPTEGDNYLRAISAILKQEHNERVGVMGYAAVGDGVATDQTAVAAAVAAAYAAGIELYWPAGTYLTTGTIANFHDVRHRGPGVVKRGSDLFAVEPATGDTNVLYLSTAGSSSNDGLSSSQPIDTLTNAWAAIDNYGPHLKGKWKIQHAAGTYSGYHRVPYNLSSEKLVELIGPDVGGHPNVPTAIYDGNAAADKMLSCINAGMKIKIKDIKVQELETNAVEMNRGLLVCENLHTLDCTTGIVCGEGGTLYVSGGIHEVSAGYATGFARIWSVFNVKHNIGYSYAESTGNPTQDASISAAPQLTAGNASGRGIMLQEGSTGHVYALIDGFSKGIEIFSRARANLDTTDLRNNGVGLELEALCDADGSPVFNKGTADANTQSVSIIGGGMFYQAYASDPATAIEYRVALNYTGESVTGTTSVDTIGGTLYTMSGQDFDTEGCTLRLKVAGSITGTAGTKTIHMRAAGTQIGSIAFPAAASGAFYAEICMRQISDGSQYITSHGIAGNAGSAGTAEAGHGTSSVTFADGTPRAITCSVQLGDAADTIDVDLVELFRTN